VGAYTVGTDARIDEAINFYPTLQRFLKQNMNTAMDWQTSIAGLEAMFKEHDSRIQEAAAARVNTEMVSHVQA